MPPVMMINEKKYGRLLAKVKPAFIRTDAEQDRLAEILMRLTVPPRELSPEEERLVELLGHLVEDYEDRQRAANPTPKFTPLEMLEAVMEMGNLRQVDLVDVFGSQGTASQVLAGKRQINLEHARRLAARFRMPIERFIA